jgi:GntR family carbon starvation induced transcriptional regulator
MAAPHDTFVEFCYKSLKEGIIRGEFAPGEKLRIAKLKSQLNVGPTPIREALCRLTATGLVIAEANRGFYVKQVTENEIKDVYSTFTKIELLALDQAIDLGDITWEANIIASLHRLSVLEKTPSSIDTNQWLALNYDFHYSLVVACNSPCLLKIREDIYQLFDRYCHLSLLINPGFLPLNNKDHCEIATAVIARDKMKACQLTLLHLENSLEQVLKKLNKIL